MARAEHHAHALEGEPDDHIEDREGDAEAAAALAAVHFEVVEEG